MKRIEDLTGQTFNDLSVIRPVRIKGRLYYECKCICGNIKNVRPSHLISGHTKSCGCLSSRTLLKDLTGKTFGRLVVLSRAASDKTNHTRWTCQCTCGKIITVNRDALISKKQVSCGCYNIELKRRARGELHPRKKYNQYDLTKEYGVGLTINTNKEFYFDMEDYDKIKQYCWRESANGYIVSYDYKHKKQNLMLHRLIMGLSSDDIAEVDHIYHKKYDNRKSQLRIVTHSDNLKNQKINKHNTSGVKGVYYNKINDRYYARIDVNKRHINIGSSKNFEVAVKLRKEAEQKYFGEYAYVE